MNGEPIRVLFFIDRFAVGGAQRQLLNLLRGIDKRRFRCRVVTIYRGGGLEDEVQGIPGLEVTSLDRRGKLDPSTLVRAVSAVREFRADIAYCLLPVTSVFGLSAALLCRTPVRIASKRTGGPRRTSIGDGLYRWAEMKLMRFAHAVVANSEAGRDFLLSRGMDPTKVRVIHNGLDLAPLAADSDAIAAVKRRLGINGSAPVLGMVASLTVGKDHRTLLHAFGILRRDFPDARLALVGDGPLRGELQGCAAGLGLDGSVVFLGNEASLGPVYSALDVVVLSSTMPEGCSNVLLEAMAMGRPVVATDAGGNRELVKTGETGYLVPPGAPQALAAGMARALRDRRESQEMALQAREIVLANFSLDGMVREHEELFENLYRARVGGPA